MSCLTVANAPAISLYSLLDFSFEVEVTTRTDKNGIKFMKLIPFFF